MRKIKGLSIFFAYLLEEQIILLRKLSVIQKSNMSAVLRNIIDDWIESQKLK